VTKPCTITAPPPANAKVRDCGKASAVRAIRSYSSSSGTWLGRRARRVDQRTPRRPNPRREIHLAPQGNQLNSVDQFTDILQRASTSTISYRSRRRIESPRSHRTSRGLGPDQNNLAGRPTLPRSDPHSSSSACGTTTSRTQPGRLLPGAASPLTHVMVPQTGPMRCVRPSTKATGTDYGGNGGFERSDTGTGILSAQRRDDSAGVVDL
jgi:hypothetical protein